jgi:anti-sigma-K factor RskA
MSDDNHVLDSLPAYTVGCLEGTEARQVAMHLAGCQACRREFKALREVADELALLAPAADPPPELKQQLMDRVKVPRPAAREPASVPAARPQRAGRWMPAWAVVSLALILALITTNLLLWQRVRSLDILVARPGMRAVALRHSDAAPLASGFVIISGNGASGTLVVDELPQLAEQQQYQVWLVRNNQYTAGPVFSVNEDGYRGMRIDAPESLHLYELVCITIEPAGGSPQPTGVQVMNTTLRNP